MSSERMIAVVICAAGSSKRMGGLKKEYLFLESREQRAKSKEVSTVLGAVVRAFSAVPSVSVIAIAIPENGEEAACAAIPSEYLSASKPKVIFVNGGDTRQASVYNALCTLKEYNPAFVLIHDGARPWVSTGLIQNIIEAVQKYNAVIPILPLTETPKEIDGGFITNHPKRANICLAQTPQAFKFPEILQAHKDASLINEEFTDDAEVWGRFCGKVAVITGEAENKKITFQGDL